MQTKCINTFLLLQTLPLILLKETWIKVAFFFQISALRMFIMRYFNFIKLDISMLHVITRNNVHSFKHFPGLQQVQKHNVPSNYPLELTHPLLTNTWALTIHLHIYAAHRANSK